MKKTALITGASSGIGKDFAKEFAKDGYDLVLVARNESAMKALGAELQAQFGTNVLVLPKDLSLPLAAQQVYTEVEAAGWTIDALVNNAGFGSFGFFAETDVAMEMEMLQVNILTLTSLTKAFLPGMIARQSGRILNVASTAAFQPGPLMAVYYASKAYVLSFTEALANELQGTGVTVTALCPGPTRSGFQSKSKMERSKLVQNKIMDTQTVASVGYRALQRGKTISIPGFLNKLLAASIRLTPRSLVPKVVRKMQEEV